jgi:ribose 5-phosphate isomerase B
MKIILASDHAGFLLKEKVKSFLLKKKFSMKDLSPALVKGDDYPLVAFSAGKKVVVEKAIGIFFCGSGQGMCLSANKVKGVRAGLAYDVSSAKVLREHNDANVLCLGGRVLEYKDALKIVNVFLSSKFLGGRHKRRVSEIERFEKFKK